MAYFEKPAAELDLQQAAVLASVIDNPSLFDPPTARTRRGAARSATATSSTGMAETGDITEEEAARRQKRLPKFPEQDPPRARTAVEGPRADDGQERARDPHQLSDR